MGAALSVLLALALQTFFLALLVLAAIDYLYLRIGPSVGLSSWGKGEEMKKIEAETAIRHLVQEWAKATGFDRTTGKQPSFSNFKSWLLEKHYAHYLSLQSERVPAMDAKQWFDEELKQT